MDKTVLIAGESWTVHSIHQKGFDSFTTTEYAEGVGWLRSALESGGWTVDFMPSHVAARNFPATAADLARYDCVMLSDIGANTLLLHPETFSRSRILPNRLESIRDYVLQGGGLVMVGATSPSRASTPRRNTQALRSKRCFPSCSRAMMTGRTATGRGG